MVQKEYWFCKSETLSGIMMLLSMGLMLVCIGSPMKTSFCVTVYSLMVAMKTYMMTMNTFPSAAVMISFSSGMMILFSYCGIMSSHESKSKTNIATVTLILTASVSLFCQSEKFSTMNKVLMNMSLMCLIFMMSVILLTMVCINYSIMMKQKPLMKSY